MFIKDIPVGTLIHNIELYPGKGAQLVRSAGNSAQLMARKATMHRLDFQAAKLEMIRLDCKATIGVVEVTNSMKTYLSVKPEESVTWVGDRQFVVLL